MTVGAMMVEAGSDCDYSVSSVHVSYVVCRDLKSVVKIKDLTELCSIVSCV